MTKPSRSDSGYCETKQEAVEALRAAWALERDWRAEMRVLTAHDDGGMTYYCVAMVAWEGYQCPVDVEMRGLHGFARDLGLDEATVREIL